MQPAKDEQLDKEQEKQDDVIEYDFRSSLRRLILIVYIIISSVSWVLYLSFGNLEGLEVAGFFLVSVPLLLASYVAAIIWVWIRNRAQKRSIGNIGHSTAAQSASLHQEDEL